MKKYKQSSLNSRYCTVTTCLLYLGNHQPSPYLRRFRLPSLSNSPSSNSSYDDLMSPVCDTYTDDCVLYQRAMVKACAADYGSEERLYHLHPFSSLSLTPITSRSSAVFIQQYPRLTRPPPPVVCCHRPTTTIHMVIRCCSVIISTHRRHLSTVQSHHWDSSAPRIQNRRSTVAHSTTCNERRRG
jgi:hypothetical protein